MAELNPAITGDSPLTQMRLISTRSDADGMPVTITKVREAALAMATATPPSEAVSGGIWTKTYQEPISDLLCWKVTESRVLATGTPGATVSPIIREDKWNNELGVMEAHFWQYVPSGATKQIIGTTYSTGDSYVSDSITALTVADPGSGYITIPTLAISAPNGAGTLATATVTSLAVVSAASSTPGTGYAIGDTLTVAGGTFTSAATLTITGGTLATLAINSTGRLYAIGDTVTLAGGAHTTPATITVVTLGLSACTVNAYGTGYAPGDTITLAGGTFTTAATITLSSTHVSTVVGIANAGTIANGADGTRTAIGTTGTGVTFSVSVTVSGGLISAVGAIASRGAYTVNPTVLTNEPVTGTGIPTGAELNITMGARGNTVTTKGSYTVGSATFTQSATSGGGTGATFTSGGFGISTFTITAGGAYTAPGVTTFTAGSTSGSGAGATFQTATYTPTSLSVGAGGAYTVIAPSPDAVTGGTGSSMTVNLNFGIGAAALSTPGFGGSTYYYPPTITPSYGSAVIAPTMSTPILLPGSPAGYVVDSALLNTEHALIKRLTWTAMPLPPTRVEYHSKAYPLPDIFTYISPWQVPGYPGFYAKPPFPGVNYTTIANGVSTNPARVTISYTNGPSGNVPATWRVITPGVQSKIFSIGQNTIHNAIIQAETGPSGTLTNELTPASTPASYIRGQTLIIDASERRTIGNFYERRVMTIT
jgi:hypothetical protein